jgi:hypothetical protein
MKIKTPTLVLNNDHIFGQNFVFASLMKEIGEF